MVYLGDGVVCSFTGDLGLPPLRIGGQAQVHSETDSRHPEHRMQGARRKLVRIT